MEILSEKAEVEIPKEKTFSLELPWGYRRGRDKTGGGEAIPQVPLMTSLLFTGWSCVGDISWFSSPEAWAEHSPCSLGSCLTSLCLYQGLPRARELSCSARRDEPYLTAPSQPERNYCFLHPHLQSHFPATFLPFTAAWTNWICWFNLSGKQFEKPLTPNLSPQTHECLLC